MSEDVKLKDLDKARLLQMCIGRRLLMDKVKIWLRAEISDNQDVVDAKDNNEEEVTSDGTDDIIYGRHECATCLYEQILEWEKKI
jgi:hypothetical protein